MSIIEVKATILRDQNVIINDVDILLEIDQSPAGRISWQGTFCDESGQSLKEMTGDRRTLRIRLEDGREGDVLLTNVDPIPSPSALGARVCFRGTGPLAHIAQDR